VAKLHPFGSYFAKQKMFRKCITQKNETQVLCSVHVYW